MGAWTMIDLTPPQDIAAERAVLGCCLVSPAAYDEAVTLISTEDWYRPAHAALWLLMRRVAATGTNVDAITVNAALSTADAETRRTVTSVLIADLIGTVGVAASVGRCAAIVAEAGLRRRLITAAEAIAQRAVELESAADAAEWAVAETTLVRNTQHTPEATDVDVHDLLTERITDEWVLPGLLASGDRFILTATEGLEVDAAAADSGVRCCRLAPVPVGTDRPAASARRGLRERTEAVPRPIPPAHRAGLGDGRPGRGPAPG